MDMPCNDELRIRYDRQVRLWGSATQQALQNCRLALVGLSGVAGEVAKNLVLSGVGAVSLVATDDVVRAADLVASHLMRPVDDDGAAFALPAAAMRTGLQRLNPFVSLTCSDGRPPSAADFCELFRSHGVMLLTNQPLSDIVAAAEAIDSCATSSSCCESGVAVAPVRYFATVNQFGPLALSLLLPCSRAGPGGLRQAVTKLTSDPEALRTRPKPFQLAALLLHATARSGLPDTARFEAPASPLFRAGASLPDKVRALLDLKAALRLDQLDDADLQLALDIAMSQRGHALAANAIDCSIVGGIVAQQVVAAVSGVERQSEDGAKRQHVFLWSLHCTLAHHMECFVGDS